MLKCYGVSKAQFVKELHAKSNMLKGVIKGNFKKLLKNFSNLRKSKLLPRGDSPFQIIEKINNNAYILDMPQSYKGNHTFHISDLSSFSCTLDSNLRSNSFKEGEPDKDIISIQEDMEEE
ncbi:hypothetical protein CR513_61534, partial [Mucuna pruriens]